MSTRSGASAIRARRGHKERSKNFTELEKRTVLELIARHRDVLRQGRSNNATNRSKQLVWSTICEEVNKRCGGERPRTPAQVKMWYENYKKKCKMRAHDTQPTPEASSGILDGMLWQSIHPLDVKDEEGEATTSVEGSHSIKDDDCIPVNMSNGRLSSTNDSDDTMPNVLEPQVQIIPQSSPTPPPHKTGPNPAINPLTLAPHILANPLQALEQARIQQNFLQKLNEMSNTPLNLSHLDDEKRRNGHDRSQEKTDEQIKHDCGTATEEERLYFSAKRQHAIWEHEAKMKILNMELRQKEEIFSLQKQLFLIELRLKMDFLEKASGK
uniref:Regulatory protein zeste n=1 Tax=Papilio machaon TaxID=76193 RepID=A0A0U5AUQ0_PAPMA|nr:apontic-like [Papilio machaon]